MLHKINIDSKLVSKKLEELIRLPTVIRVNGFGEEDVKEFIESLRRAEEAKQDIVPIIINSYGGNVYSLLSMMDYIETCDKQIATIVEGKAMSAGAVLFSCGDEGSRYVSPNATIMIHEVSTFSWGKVNDIEVSTKESKRLNGLILRKMAKNCGQPADYFINLIHERSHADWYLTPKQAKDHNLANHIGLPKFKIDVSVTMELVNQ